MSARDAAETAERDLLRRQARAVTSLIFRILTLPILVTLLCRQSPALNPVRPLLEAASVAVALFPFVAVWGRLTRVRIALGRTAAEKSDWVAAVRLLKPLGTGMAARLFDAAGEGRYHLALAFDALGQTGKAQRLFGQLAADVGERSEWGRKAIAAAIAPSPVSASGKASTRV